MTWNKDWLKLSVEEHLQAFRVDCAKGLSNEGYEIDYEFAKKYNLIDVEGVNVGLPPVDPIFGTTVMGFNFVEFNDDRNNSCAIQKSPEKKWDFIWLEVSDGVGMKRVHLNKAQAEFLKEVLEHFVDTGEVKNEK